MGDIVEYTREELEQVLERVSPDIWKAHKLLGKLLISPENVTLMAVDLFISGELNSKDAKKVRQALSDLRQEGHFSFKSL